MSEEGLKFEYSPAQFKSTIERVENDRISNFLRLSLHRLIRRLLDSNNSFRVINQKTLLDHKNFVMIANHTSHLDVLCLLSALPFERLNNCYSVAAEDYFFSNDLVSYFSRILANTLPVSRSYGAYAGLKACGTLLDQGKSLIIFPEGTRSKNGEIQTFKSGVGILMAGRKEPVIPAYIKGAFESFPKGKLFPKRYPISVIIGDALFFANYENKEDSWPLVAQKLEAAVKELRSKN